MSILPPCKDSSGASCTKRVPGCHSHCNEYKEYRKTVDTAKDAERRETMICAYVVSAIRGTENGGARPPATILKDAQRKEERRLRDATGKVGKKPC